MTKDVQYAKCYLFYCDRRRGNFCCIGCQRDCARRCHNTPQKCGYSQNQEDDLNAKM